MQATGPRILYSTSVDNPIQMSLLRNHATRASVALQIKDKMDLGRDWSLLYRTELEAQERMILHGYPGFLSFHWRRERMNVTRQEPRVSAQTVAAVSCQYVREPRQQSKQQ